MPETKQPRFVNIDIAKGIGIILVCLGHMPTLPSCIIKFVYFFHMPLFFFISGLCFTPQKYKSGTAYMKHRAICLLYPYLTMSLAYVAVLFSTGESDFKDLICNTFIWGNGPEKGIALWFLPVLFLTESMFWTMKALSFRVWIVLSAVLPALTYCIYRCTLILPMHFEITIPALFFYGYGFFMNCRFRQIQAGNKDIVSASAALCVLAALSFILKDAMDMLNSYYPNIIIKFLCAGLGIYAVYVVSTALEKRTKKLRASFAAIGRYSIVILFTHQFAGTVFFCMKMNNSVIQKALSLVFFVVLSFVIYRYCKFFYRVKPGSWFSGKRVE